MIPSVNVVFANLRGQAQARASARSRFLATAKIQYEALANAQHNDLAKQANLAWTVPQAKAWIKTRAAARLKIMDSIYNKYRSLIMTQSQAQDLDNTKNQYVAMIRYQNAAWSRVSTRSEALALAHSQEKTRIKVLGMVYNSLVALSKTPASSVLMSQAKNWVDSQKLLHPQVLAPVAHKIVAPIVLRSPKPVQTFVPTPAVGAPTASTQPASNGTMLMVLSAIAAAYFGG